MVPAAGRVPPRPPTQVVAEFIQRLEARKRDATGALVGGPVVVSPNLEEELKEALAKLKTAELTAAVEKLGLYRDRFEFKSQKPFESIFPSLQVGDPPPAQMRARPLDSLRAREEEIRVRNAKQTKEALDSTATTPELAQKYAEPGTQVDCPDIRDAFATFVNAMRKDGGLKFSDDALKPLKDALVKAQSNGFQPSPEIDRRYQTEGRTFEDRIMNFMFKFAFKHLGEMSKLTAESDEGEATKLMDRTAQKMLPFLKEMQAQGADPGYMAKSFKDGLTPEQFAKMPPEVQQWANSAPPPREAAGAPTNGEAAAACANLPPPDNGVLAAMLKHDNPDVQLMGAVGHCSNVAKKVDAALVSDGKGGTKLDDNLSTEDARALAKDLGGSLKAISHALPHNPETKRLLSQLEAEMESVEKGLKEQTDPNERTMLGQRLNMMMQVFSQMIQALSGVMNEFNELAKGAIRKYDQH